MKDISIKSFKDEGKYFEGTFNNFLPIAEIFLACVICSPCQSNFLKFSKMLRKTTQGSLA